MKGGRVQCEDGPECERGLCQETGTTETGESDNMILTAP